MTEMKKAEIELSAGGVIYRRTPGGEFDVLLIKDGYGNWGFPKGHVEAGETSAEAALRECSEETGLRLLQARDAVGMTDWHFRAGDTLVHKYCDYFLVRSDPSEEPTPQRGEGIQACEWLVPANAVSRVTYANARRLLERAVSILAAPEGLR
jgi:8-oxo-dGTP pyrophosphatase MutT (NUDIX family)